jgi:hypothetical protein
MRNNKNLDDIAATRRQAQHDDISVARRHAQHKEVEIQNHEKIITNKHTLFRSCEEVYLLSWIRSHGV